MRALAGVLALCACGDADRDAADPTASAASSRSASTTESAQAKPGAPIAAPNTPTADEVARASATDLARQPNDVDWSGGDAASGQALYATHCAICHGGGGTGDGLATPALNPKPRDFTDGRFYLDADANNRTGEDVDLARVILHGTAAFGGSQAMSGWRDAFSDDQVRDLIAHIRTLSSTS